jgi:hypothetical protein
MRKFFSQKSKHKAHQHQTLSTTLPGTSSTVTFNKDDDTQITSTATKKGKLQTTSSHSQPVPTTQIETNSTSDESISSEIKTNHQLKQDEKSKKLFVVVSGKNFFLKIGIITHIFLAILNA